MAQVALWNQVRSQANSVGLLENIACFYPYYMFPFKFVAQVVGEITGVITGGDWVQDADAQPLHTLNGSELSQHWEKLKQRRWIIVCGKDHPTRQCLNHDLAQWLENHDCTVKANLSRATGREVNTALKNFDRDCDVLLLECHGTKDGLIDLFDGLYNCKELVLRGATLIVSLTCYSGFWHEVANNASGNTQRIHAAAFPIFQGSKVANATIYCQSLGDETAQGLDLLTMMTGDLSPELRSSPHTIAVKVVSQPSLLLL